MLKSVKKNFKIIDKYIFFAILSGITYEIKRVASLEVIIYFIYILTVQLG